MSQRKKHPLYATWLGMRDRCSRPTNRRFHRYGGRGIKVCERWQNSFEAFVEDMGPRPPKTVLDRYPNNDGNYEPGNCRWTTNKENCRNRKLLVLTIRGRSMSAIEWSERTGQRLNLILSRLYAGWTAEDAVTQPARNNSDKSHCPKGHPYSRFVSGTRRCSICDNENNQAYRRRKRAA